MSSARPTPNSGSSSSSSTSDACAAAVRDLQRAPTPAGQLVASRFRADAQVKAADGARRRKEADGLKAQERETRVPDAFPGAGYSVPSRYLARTSADKAPAPKPALETRAHRRQASPLEPAPRTEPTASLVEQPSAVQPAQKRSTSTAPSVLRSSDWLSLASSLPPLSSDPTAPISPQLTFAHSLFYQVATDRLRSETRRARAGVEGMLELAVREVTEAEARAAEDARRAELEREGRLLDALATDDMLVGLLQESAVLAQETKAAVTVDPTSSTVGLPRLSKLLRQIETCQQSIGRTAARSPSQDVATLLRALLADVNVLRTTLQRAIKTAKTARDADPQAEGDGERGVRDAS